MSVLDKDVTGAVTQTVRIRLRRAETVRIAKRVNGDVTRFLLNGDNIWADANGAGVPSRNATCLGIGSDGDARTLPPGARRCSGIYGQSLASYVNLADSTGTVANHMLVNDSFGRNSRTVVGPGYRRPFPVYRPGVGRLETGVLFLSRTLLLRLT